MLRQKTVLASWVEPRSAISKAIIPGMMRDLGRQTGYSNDITPS